jgi:hypothetical protein
VVRCRRPGLSRRRRKRCVSPGYSLIAVRVSLRQPIVPPLPVPPRLVLAAMTV